MKVKFNFNKNHLLAFVIIIFLLTVLYLMRSRGRVRESLNRWANCKQIRLNKGTCNNEYKKKCAVGSKMRKRWKEQCKEKKR